MLGFWGLREEDSGCMELTFQDVTFLRPITRLVLESVGLMGVPCSVLQDLEWGSENCGSWCGVVIQFRGSLFLSRRLKECKTWPLIGYEYDTSGTF